MTKYWTVHPSMEEKFCKQAVQEAAEMIKHGKVVAFPTETVYGLGANAADTKAVRAIFTAKGRPADNPLIVHIASRSQLSEFIVPSALTQTVALLMDRFWPGPLTIVLPALPDAVSPLVSAGLSTLAVRIPDHEIALQLIRAAGCPLAAPSANLSGRPSPTQAEHVKQDLDGRIDGIIDAGPCGIGVESTVVEPTSKGVRILRPGGVSREDLLEVVGEVDMGDSLGTGEKGNRPRSPGMKYKHYAPQGNLYVIQGEHGKVMKWMEKKTAQAKSRGEKTGLLRFQAAQPLTQQFTSAVPQADVVIDCGTSESTERMALVLYDALRRFDEQNVTYILAEACPEQGIGLAVMNRLLKASGNRLIKL